MIESELETVKRGYDKIKDLVPTFLSDVDVLVRKLGREVSELKLNEERQKEKLREYDAKLDRLQEENRSLRHYKKEYEELKKTNDKNMPLLDDYSRQIDSLNQQNIDLQEQNRRLEHDLTTFRQKEQQYIDDLNQQNIERDRLLSQCEHQKKVELANQAAEHKHQVSKTEKSFKDALKSLEVAIKERNDQINDQKETIKKLEKEIKVMPYIHASILTREAANKQKENVPKPGCKFPIIPVHMPNPATKMRKAVAGSSYSSSTSSSSSLHSYSRRRSHNVEPFGIESKRHR